MYSDPITETTVNTGIMTFGISNSVEPTESTPAKVTLSVSADGYLPKSRTMTIDAIGSNQYRIELVSENNAPAGVTIQSTMAGSAQSDGSTSQDITVETNATGTNGTENGSSVSIPAGTQLLDSNGNPLSGQISAKTSYYNPDEVGGMANLPSEQAENEIIYGAMAMSLVDENGNKAATVGTTNAKYANNSTLNSEGYEISFVMTADKYNELTSTDYAFKYIASLIEGEKSISEPTRVNTLPDGRKQMVFTVYEELTLHAQLVSTVTSGGTGRCGYLYTIRQNSPRPFSIIIYDSGFYSNDYYPNTESLAIHGVLGNVRIEYEYGAIFIPSSDLECNGERNIQIPDPPSGYVDEVTVNATVKCKTDGEKLRVDGIPTSALVYRKQNAEANTDWRVASGLEWNYDKVSKALVGGSAVITGVEENATYDFKIAYDGNVYDAQIPMELDSNGEVSYIQEVDSEQCE
jgi:hypothetical protein